MTSTTIDSSSSEPAAGTDVGSDFDHGRTAARVNVAVHRLRLGRADDDGSTVLVEIENVGDAELTVTAVTVSGSEGDLHRRNRVRR